MKKTVAVLISVVMMLFSLVLISSAEVAPSGVSTIVQDGLEASMENLVSKTGFTSYVQLRNSSEYITKIQVKLEFPQDDSFHIAKDNSAEVDIPAGTERIFKFVVEQEAKEEFPIVWIIVIVVVLLVIAASVLICRKLGRKRSGQLCALLMVGVSIFLMLPISVAAADEVRSFTISDTVTVGKKEVMVVATVSYHYNDEEPEVIITEPDVMSTAGMGQFEITYYWGPHGDDILNEDYIRAIAECGFTSIPIENNTVENNKAALELLQKYGLTCSALWDQRIYNVSYTDTPFSQEEVDTVIAEVVEDYKDFENLKGYYIMDEPSAKRFENLAKVVSAFRRLDPERVCMINLFPNYANAQQLGRDTYEQYLSDYITEVHPYYLSYDHYHFKKGTDGKSFFTNLEAVRKAGLESDIEQMLIILLTEHGSYADLTPTQIAWEVNMSFVYGMKRISYFTFWLDQDLLDDGWTNSCMDVTGKIYQHYYDVQAINQWVLPLGKELFDKTSTAVFHVASESNMEDGCTAYESYGKLGQIEGEDAVIGFFDDDSFMIVNRNCKGLDAATREYTLLEYSDGISYFDTDSATWKSLDEAEFASKNSDGKYVISLNAGMAVLLRADQ